MGGGLMSERVFLLPDLGEGLSEAEIVEWRVAVGDTVTVDQAVVEVETAKAVVDVPCPYAGRVVALHGMAGEVRPVGQPLITIASLDAVETDAAPVSSGGPVVNREQERAGSGNVLIGYGTGHGGAARRRRPRVARSVPTDAASGGAARTEATSGGGTRTNPVPSGGRGAPGVSVRVISPIVRRLAKQHGVDLAALRGTGRGGVIRRADVEAATPAPVAVPAVDAVPADGEVILPLTGIRKVIADKLSRSRQEIPEVTIWVDADATALLETRAAINAATPAEPVSILALLARICLSGLRRFPQLNARVDSGAQRIVQSAGVHLGIAAQTDRGLVVPVLRDAQRLTTAGLAAALAETTAAARAGTLPPTRLTGGTFTLNNYGVFGVDGSTPIINHPEAALLGVGRIVDKPWVVDGQLAVRKVTQLSLTFDHRVCDGGVAGGFLRHVADCVERPAVLIANL
ncbi:dihydrolipoamide acetyltransferase family protein [Salinispora oceanensis]|uniref:dihydrolipoamide acetyltransferase family protein n=1 Tax=Salinispora oceanensis TaxID=1050199 RepID=UPI00035EA00F|nr:dihydrolipoamide acetyltransferase family protein [Salinispora oceanensis]